MPQALQAMFDSVPLNHIIGTNAGIKLGYYSVMLSCVSSLMCATARQAQTCQRARAACDDDDLVPKAGATSNTLPKKPSTHHRADAANHM